MNPIVSPALVSLMDRFKDQISLSKDSFDDLISQTVDLDKGREVVRDRYPDLSDEDIRRNFLSQDLLCYSLVDEIQGDFDLEKVDFNFGLRGLSIPIEGSRGVVQPYVGSITNALNTQINFITTPQEYIFDDSLSILKMLENKSLIGKKRFKRDSEHPSLDLVEATTSRKLEGLESCLFPLIDDPQDLYDLPSGTPLLLTKDNVIALVDPLGVISYSDRGKRIVKAQTKRRAKEMGRIISRKMYDEIGNIPEILYGAIGSVLPVKTREISYEFLSPIEQKARDIEENSGVEISPRFYYERRGDFGGRFTIDELTLLGRFLDEYKDFSIQYVRSIHKGAETDFGNHPSEERNYIASFTKQLIDGTIGGDDSNGGFSVAGAELGFMEKNYDVYTALKLGHFAQGIFPILPEDVQANYASLVRNEILGKTYNAVGPFNHGVDEQMARALRVQFMKDAVDYQQLEVLGLNSKLDLSKRSFFNELFNNYK